MIFGALTTLRGLRAMMRSASLKCSSALAAATHLFRIAQEAVSNAIKHGKTERISISLRTSRGRIILKVSDNGIGFPKTDSKDKGMGLRIMQSRAGMIGGTMAIEHNTSG